MTMTMTMTKNKSADKKRIIRRRLLNNAVNAVKMLFDNEPAGHMVYFNVLHHNFRLVLDPVKKTGNFGANCRKNEVCLGVFGFEQSQNVWQFIWCMLHTARMLKMFSQDAEKLESAEDILSIFEPEFCQHEKELQTCLYHL